MQKLYILDESGAAEIIATSETPALRAMLRAVLRGGLRLAALPDTVAPISPDEANCDPVVLGYAVEVFAPAISGGFAEVIEGGIEQMTRQIDEAIDTLLVAAGFGL